MPATLGTLCKLFRVSFYGVLLTTCPPPNTFISSASLSASVDPQIQLLNLLSAPFPESFIISGLYLVGTDSGERARWHSRALSCWKKPAIPSCRGEGGWVSHWAGAAIPRHTLPCKTPTLEPAPSLTTDSALGTSGNAPSASNLCLPG